VLRLSNRARYAVRALYDLAMHLAFGDADSSRHVRDVASRQRIPVRFLEQIFQELKRAGLVESKRGPRGGFRLARSPDDVRLGDVLRAVEGPVALAPQASISRTRSARDHHHVADMRDVADAFLADIGRSVEQCFDDVTLRDLCVRGEQLGLRAGAGAGQPPGDSRSLAAPPRWVI
jgi:Rrf2 family iron-sulfur cluster assembly transcriptional regulator